MSRKHLFFAVGLVIVIVAAVAVIVNVIRLNTAPLIDTKNIILNDAYQLDTTLNSDIVVFGNRLTLTETSTVNGNVALVGEVVLVSGTISGDLAVAASEIHLENAVVNGNTMLMANKVVISGTFHGDFAVTGESVVVDPASIFNGLTNVCPGTRATSPDGSPLTFECAERGMFAPLEALVALRTGTPVIDWRLSLTTTQILVFGVLFSGLMAGLASLTVTVFPLQISRIEEAIRSTPRRMTGVGLATFGLGVGLSLALIVMLAAFPPVGLLLIPFYLIAGLGLLTLIVIGWVTLSLVIGDRLVMRNGRRVPPLLLAAVGSLILSLGITVLALLPFGIILLIVALIGITSVGVGAAMLTRLGTRPVRRASFVQG